MRVRLAALLPALLLCCAGCASVAKPGAPAPAGAPAERPPDLPRVEAQFIADPARIAPALRDDQDFMPPHPIVTHLPQYPPGHEDAVGPVVVVLRFVVGNDGAVVKVRDSPLRDPGGPSGGGGDGHTGGVAADPAFREAAVDAVLSWLFVPAAIRTVKPGPDLDHDSKADYTVLVESERMPVYLDVRFTFEIIEGEGRVRID